MRAKTVNEMIMQPFSNSTRNERINASYPLSRPQYEDADKKKNKKKKMKAKLVKESLEPQNEGLGVLGVIAIAYLSWVGLKKLLKFLVNTSLRQVIKGTLGGLEELKIHASEKFKEEIKVLELDDRYKISIPDGLNLIASGSSKKFTIRDILLFKDSKEIKVNADGFRRELVTRLTDREYESVVNLIQSEV
jgi:hypothetical protein